MLKLPVAIKQDSILNIVSRNTVTIAIIKELQGDGKYKIQILGSDKEHPNIYANDPNIEYAVNDRVGILWEYGCREKPIIVGILDEIIEEEVTGGTNALGL
ncbi:hypothetical protein ES705_41936 [subsurface metagenome]